MGQKAVRIISTVFNTSRDLHCNPCVLARGAGRILSASRPLVSVSAVWMASLFQIDVCEG